MARRFTLQIIMDLASQIGANPAKAVSRSNISFLGKGPTKNPLFQHRLAGLENAKISNLGDRDTIISATEDAIGWMKDGKLNSIQTEILGHNLTGINKVLNPPPLPTLPMASVTPIRSGIKTVAPKPRSDIDQLLKEGHTDVRGRRWDFESRLPEPGPGDIEAFNAALNQKTGMSRAIARNLLLKDTRLKLSSEDLSMLKEGKGEPLDLMQKYYGESMSAYDDFLNNVSLEASSPRDLATRILREVELIPQFAEGGLADVLQVRSGYSKGRIAKNVLAILNRNKKNADYMFKASDNVSPGYAKGDLKYNAELLADQLAEDAGVIYDDLGQLDRIKFYGTAYDYLAAEMGKYRQMTKMLKDVEQKMVLSDFNIKGRKPSASGGLAGILEV